MAELDKFKRRLIRLVARQILLQEQTEDVMWEQLRKENNCDCQLLWKRMRVLTIKKLKRLLAADDKTESIAAVARMSVTDWLLFDLVLVHEKLDLIDKENIATNKKESPVMYELFELVKQYKVEELEGAALADAWIRLTKEYNSKGRQVSPMLLQRRWYQVKELTRSTFYQLWFSYRGNKIHWAKACSETEPTQLQTHIVKEFPSLVTCMLPEWEELIQQKKVIVSFEEHQMRMPPPQTDVDDKQDVEMIEPEIETIDLGDSDDDNDAKAVKQENFGDQSQDIKQETTNFVDQKQEYFISDSQSSREYLNFEQDDVSTEFNLSTVKQEPVDEDGLTNVRILETSHVEETPSTSKVQRNKQLTLELENTVKQFSEIQQLEYAERKCAPGDESVDTVIESDMIPDDLIKQKADEYIKSKKAGKTVEVTKKTIKSVIDETVQESFEDIIKKKADEFVRKVDLKKSTSAAIEDRNMLKNRGDINVLSEVRPVEVSSASSDILNSSIEFVDDGIEDEEYDIINIDIGKVPPILTTTSQTAIEKNKTAEENEDDDESSESNFDLKLLMSPVVYTVKLDQMTTFINEPFSRVTQSDVIAKAFKESMPIKKAKEQEFKSLNQIESECEKKEEDLSSTNAPISSIRDVLRFEEEPVFDGTVKMEPEDFDYDDNITDSTETSDIDESLKVKPTSYMFRKPRHRSYNPIQVCKNPDFNTRLKRLTVGFFTSPRNRQLFNTCKPLTVDLSKSFEEKLVNGTIYLKSSGEIHQQAVKQQEIVTPTVVPSAVPIQSLLKHVGSKCDIKDLVSAPVNQGTVDLTAHQYGGHKSKPDELITTDDEVTARNKVINLKDLSEIRRINQKLKTAQVTPIRVENKPEKSNIEQLHTALLQDIGEIPANGSFLLCNETMNPDQDLTDTSPPKELVSRKSVPSNNTMIPVQDLTSPTKLVVYKQPDPSTVKPLTNKATTNNSIPVMRVTSEPKQISRKSIKVPPEQTLKKSVEPSTSAIRPPYISAYRPSPSSRVKVPWLSKRQTATADDSCITIDTLNRMINKLTGTNIDFKKHPTVPDTVAYPCPCTAVSEVEATVNADEVRTEKKSEESTDNLMLGASENVEKVKTRLVSHSSRHKECKPRGRPPVHVQCCWARRKIVAMMTNSRPVAKGKHACDKICKCCCRRELVQILPAYPAYMFRMRDSSIWNVDGKAKDDGEPSLLFSLKQNLKGPSNTSIKQMVEVQQDISTPIPQPNVVVDPAVILTNKEDKTTPMQDIPTPQQASIELSDDEATQEAVMPKIRVYSGSLAKKPPVQIKVPAPTPVQPPTDPKPLFKVNVSFTSAQPPPLQIIPKQTINQSISSIPYIERITTKPNNNMQQKFIVVDGTLPQSNEIKISSKSILQKPTDSPIFLGKDKILLTTVKFPPHIACPEAFKKKEVLKPKVLPNLDLPTGVQIILMSNGQLNCVIDPAVKLTHKEISALPGILAAVQKQIDEQTKSASVLQPPLVESEINSAVENILPASAPIADSPAVVMAPNVDENIPNTETPGEATNLNASNDSEIITVEDVEVNKTSGEQNTTEQCSAKTPKTSAANESNDGRGSRNLLSDLMEMSGISAEDATPAATSQAPAVTAVPPVQTLDPMLAPGTEPTELSPIVTLEQLKYACQEKGKFYKLDLITGVIMPINVCLRKNMNIVAKSVIDLTDDGDKEVSETGMGGETSESQKPVTEKPVIAETRESQQTEAVKPVKLFKVHTASLLRRYATGKSAKSLLRQKRKAMFNEYTNKIKHSRKQDLSKIDTRIDLVDSDAPMEEEYLVDSSDSDEPAVSMRTEGQVTEHDATTKPDSDDSSDDEPLAQKFIRIKSFDPYMREVTASIEAIKSNTPDTPVVPRLVYDEAEQVPIAVEALNTEEEKNAESEMELEESTMPFLADDTMEQEEEDCILGV